MLEIATNRQPKLISIANLFRALHENEIVYCNLKGNDRHLEYAMTGESDIDVLFDEKQKAKTEAVLSKLGFKKFVAIKQKQFKDIVDFLTLDLDSGKVIHLHTYYGLTIGQPYLKGYQLALARDILNTRMFNEAFGLYCIQPAYELILLYVTESLKLRHRDFVRMYFNNKITLPEKTAYQHHWLKDRTDQTQVEELLKTIFKDHATISKVFRSEFSRKCLQQLNPFLKKELSHYRLYSPVVALLLRWYREGIVMLRRKLSGMLIRPMLSMRVNPRGGIVVAVSGEDVTDTYATTVRNLLVQAFETKLDVYEASFRHKRNNDVRNSAVVRKKGFLPLLNQCIDGLMTAWTKMSIIRRVRSAKNQGALVICDHYPQDLPVLSCLLNSGNVIFRAMAWLESKTYKETAAYSPNLVFSFKNAKHAVEPGSCGGNIPVSLEVAPAEVKEVALKNKCKVVTVDAAQALNETLCLIKEEIWNAL